MIEQKTILSDERIMQATGALYDLIETVLLEQGITAKTVAVAVHSSAKNNALIVGCGCPGCLAELHSTMRKVANGRKAEEAYEVVKKAVH